MLCSVRTIAAIALGGLVFSAVVTGSAFAQSNTPEQKPAEQKSPEEQAKEAQRRSIEEYAEAAKLPGNAGLPGVAIVLPFKSEKWVTMESLCTSMAPALGSFPTPSPMRE